MNITCGNAGADGAAFNHWFVGDLAQWCAVNPTLAHDFGLRQSSAVEIKWGQHRAGERRADWAACSDKVTLSLLVRGRFLLRFRAPATRDVVTERRLLREGDYAIWDAAVEHTWVVEEDSVILTVRWPGTARS